MPKSYEANKIKDNPLIRIIIATPENPIYKVIPGDKSGDEIYKYYTAYQKIQAIGMNGEMETKPKVIEKWYGSPKDKPWTIKEVGNAIKNFNNLNTILYNDLKQLYLDLINEDIT